MKNVVQPLIIDRTVPSLCPTCLKVITARPIDCGICENHKTGTLLGNIDVTSRCNLSCPVCFADAGNSATEPTMDQLRSMMRILRDQRPVPCSAIQFSGSEPTMRDDLPEIVTLTRQLGFFQIQVATNGLKLASSPNLCLLS